MNARGIEIFEDETKKNQGLYTVGIYEKVIRDAGKSNKNLLKSNAKNNANQHKSSKPSKPVDTNKNSSTIPGSIKKSSTNQHINDDVFPSKIDEDSPNPLTALHFGYSSQRREDRLTYIMPVEVRESLLGGHFHVLPLHCDQI